MEQEKDLGVLISSDLKPDRMVARQVQKAHLKLTQFNSTFSYRGKTWLKLYQTYVKPSLLYASEAWRPTTKEGVVKREGVQKRAMRMAGGMGDKDYREACKREGMILIGEDLKVTDTTRVYCIIYGHDKIEKSTFWRMEQAREGAGRRRFREKEVTRTIATQRKETRKRSFVSRIQDDRNTLDDRIKKASRMYNAEFAGGEAFQVANYGIGGVYNHHPDPHNWHHPQKQVAEEQRPEEVVNGDRVATFMGYLSNVELGGATVFPNAGVTIWPEKGSATLWWNLVSNGLTDQMTVHGGCPVIVGSKWITNKWIRWKAQGFKFPCTSKDSGYTRQPLLSNDLCSGTNTHACRLDQEVFIKPNYYYESLKRFSPDFQ